MVLCNDNPETFGSPDVLQCSLAQLSVAYDTATLLPDRPPNKAGACRWGAGLPKPGAGRVPLQLRAVLVRCSCSLPSSRAARPSPPGRFIARSHGSFLNSSTSRWEALWDSWPMRAEFVDIVSPVYLSDRQM